MSPAYTPLTERELVWTIQFVEFQKDLNLLRALYELRDLRAGRYITVRTSHGATTVVENSGAYPIYVNMWRPNERVKLVEDVESGARHPRWCDVSRCRLVDVPMSEEQTCRKCGLSTGSTATICRECWQQEVEQ